MEKPHGLAGGESATVLVVGATGATGHRLVGRLRARGIRVRAAARSARRLPAELREDPGVEVVEAGILDLDDAERARLVDGCAAVASCLGHTATVRGVLGPPWRLVTEATQRLDAAIRATSPSAPVRFVLMNSAACRNPDEDGPLSRRERLVLALLRVLVPPHRDNERAADHLRTVVGPRDGVVEWAAVRPDTLTDGDDVTPYELHPAPTRSALFDPGKTSRINVADFMAELIADRETWTHWRGRMPVIYDRT